ncbi:MAG: bacterioferritin [Elusimicrobia bacterium]|nr:bacterioferritin [Elusimicrobiota bacterium]
MKGDSKIIEALNKALTIELTAINQYFVQSKMCRNWGYHKLAKKHFDESLEEMRHAEKLIDRVLFLEGVPNIARYDVIRVGTDVKRQFENDLKLEIGGVKSYNEAIDLCAKLKDGGSREILEHILEESEEHVDWLESQLHVIGEIGLANYLSEQLGEEKKG